MTDTNTDTKKDKIVKFIKEQGPKWFVCVVAFSLYTISTFFYAYKLESYKPTTGMAIRIYIALFCLIGTFCLIIPIPKVVETFKFLQTQFGPGLYIIFIGKPKINF